VAYILPYAEHRMYWATTSCWLLHWQR